MDVAVIGVFIPIIAIIGGIIMIIFLRKYENDERMNMIEKGMNPAEVTKTKNTSGPLRFSMLLMGVGIGLLMGYFLESSTRMDEAAYFSMIFLFGGIGLGVAYVIEERKLKQES
ncbi:MAG: DUF6249 domain-containing protein [Bacteroidota bacterium]